MPAETHSNQPITRHEIASLIASQLAEILEKDASDIVEGASFESLGADSLALIDAITIFKIIILINGEHCLADFQ